MRKSHTTIKIHQEDEHSKATNSQDECKSRLATKKRTKKHRTITESKNGSNNQKRIDNTRTTALEPMWTAAKATGEEGLNVFYWYQIFAPDAPVFEAQNMLSSRGGFLTIPIYHHREKNIIKFMHYEGLTTHRLSELKKTPS